MNASVPSLPAALPQRLGVAWRRADAVLLAIALLLAALALFAPAQWWPSLRFVGAALLSVAPVLALSVALAAGIKASGAELLVKRSLAGRAGRATVVAALAGALSPLCSCGVVPLIAGLLAAGVPLAPVMAFWLASPIKDPAMFVLTAGVIGVDFALAKTVAALLLGLIGGFATQRLAGRSWLAEPLRDRLRGDQRAATLAAALREQTVQWRFWREPVRRRQFADSARGNAWKLGRVMVLAFLLESLMVAWVPASSVAAWLGGSGAGAVTLAVLAGVPAYLNGAAAVPLVAGLIELGMSPAVGLAFMVAGGVTSVPASMAVWTLVRARVFALYLTLALAGSLAVGWSYAAWLVFTAAA